MRMPLVLLLPLMAAATAPSRAGRRWANVTQTAEYLGVTTRTVRLMVADRRLTQYNGFGSRCPRFDLDEVDAALAATQK